MYKSYRFVCFLGIPLSVILISISDNLVPWFFGIDCMKVSDILKISSLLIVFIGISNVTYFLGVTLHYTIHHNLSMLNNFVNLGIETSRIYYLLK